MFNRYVLTLVAVTAIGCASLEASERWTDQRDSHFGFSYSFPESCSLRLRAMANLASIISPPTPEKLSFSSAPGIIEICTPAHFKRWMIANAGGYEEITYQPRGRSWFVLSGYRGDQIYYEKVMFSCGGRIVNILAIAYPTAERALFDPAVERMEDTFKPGQECAHPPQAG